MKNTVFMHSTLMHVQRMKKFQLYLFYIITNAQLSTIQLFTLNPRGVPAGNAACMPILVQHKSSSSILSHPSLGGNPENFQRLVPEEGDNNYRNRTRKLLQAIRWCYHLS